MKKTANNSVEFQGNDHIKRSLWPVKTRMDFYPTFIPKISMVFEGRVFRYMEKFCTPYCGGYWNFYTLSNGGFYIGLKQPGIVHVENHLNYYKGEMSIDAASIGVNLFALCDCTSNGDKRIIDAYYHLRDYACIHPEKEQILAFID